jgi:hypothetical protein
MERDPHISKLIREGGVISAPRGFTQNVMAQLETEPGKTAYKPLIGRWGRILIILFVVAIVVISVVYSRPGGRFVESLEIPKLGFQLPHLNLDLGFLSGVDHFAGIAAVLAAIFILVLSDAGLSKRRFLL